jgi:hypothetical protein
MDENARLTSSLKSQKEEVSRLVEGFITDIPSPAVPWMLSDHVHPFMPSFPPAVLQLHLMDASMPFPDRNCNCGATIDGDEILI